MKVHNLMRLGLLLVLAVGSQVACTAETGGELAILRVPTPSDTCEIGAEDENSLARGAFDPTARPQNDDAARIGFLIKNGLSGSESIEANDSGEAIGPSAPNNVMITGFNTCYYVENDPAYQALAADGVDAIRDDCENGSVRFREFTTTSGLVLAEQQSKPESGSVVFATLLRPSVLEGLFGQSFDVDTLAALGFANFNSTPQGQYQTCAGVDVRSDGTFAANDACDDPSQKWESGTYVPWMADPNGSTAWGTFPYRCSGTDCATTPSQTGALLDDYLRDTYGRELTLLPDATTTIVAYVQAVGETVTGMNVSSSWYLFPIDLCVGCITEAAYEACPAGLTQTVCSYGTCVVGNPTAADATVTVEDCTAPATNFTGCANAPQNACGPLLNAEVGEIPQIITCGGGYHFSNLVGYTCLARTCPQ